MKNLLLTVFLLSAICAQAQVGIGTLTPNSSAQLDVSSTSKGLLIPRMTSSQRSAISTPVAGLLVYDIDSSKMMQYNGVAWKGYMFLSDFKSSGISDKNAQQVVEMDNIQVRTRSDGMSGFELRAKTSSFIASWTAETIFLNTTGSNNTISSSAAQNSQSRTITSSTWNLLFSGSWTIHPAVIKTHLYDETTGKFYRITCFVTAGWANNQIVIERLN